jgi:tetratricopeptide (TPR) repeat protein
MKVNLIEKNIVWKWLQFILTRAVILYAVLGLLSRVVIDFDKINYGLRLRTLNFMMPSSYDYLLALEGKASDVRLNEDHENILRGYINFYEKVVEYLPQRADAYAMLGFCYYHLNDYQKSVLMYKKAFDLSPQFFWFAYDLGVIQYQLKNYPVASAFFQQAVKTDPNQTYSVLINSREIYKRIYGTFAEPEKELINRLNRGYQEAQELLSQSVQFQNGNITAPKAVFPQIF